MKVLYTLLFCIFAISSTIKAEDSLSIYIFLLDDCPICIQYTPTLNELYEEYGSEISFIGYFPNFSSKKHNIDAFNKTYNIAFPLYTDYFKTQAKKYKAQVTPEVILFNNSTNTIIYQGRIDNMFYKLGRRRKVVTEENLKDAIELTLQNKAVEKSFEEPIGCFINYSDDINRMPQKDK